jgi:membrane protease YdiL (CAAX protease family)
LLVALYVVPGAIFAALRGVRVKDPFDLLTHGISIDLVVAAVVLVGLSLIFRWWRSVGLSPSPPSRSWIWIYAAFFVPLGILAWLVPGSLPGAENLTRALTTSMLLTAGINIAFVALNEELLFRGFLWAALPERWELWRRALVTSLLFGAAHLLNAVWTGALGTALVQAVAATCTGLALAGYRRAAGWLWLPVLVHFANDAGLLRGATPVMALFTLAILGNMVVGVVWFVREVRGERRERRDRELAAMPPPAFPGVPGGPASAAPVLAAPSSGAPQAGVVPHGVPSSAMPYPPQPYPPQPYPPQPYPPQTFPPAPAPSPTPPPPAQSPWAPPTGG